MPASRWFLEYECEGHLLCPRVGRAAGAYYNRGTVHLLENDRDQAIANMRDALRLDPSHERARQTLRKLSNLNRPVGAQWFAGPNRETGAR